MNTMNIHVTIERTHEKQSLELKEKSTIKDLLTRLRVNPLTILPIINGEVVIEDHIIQDNDHVSLKSVISGG